ncbi:MAG TPA: peptidylprolyl isomerase [Candidatus Limnocylindrales bacterium]|nr:peptidylprolyl isomerase [Candidatus Limnocylindrales bacterium]
MIFRRARHKADPAESSTSSGSKSLSRVRPADRKVSFRDDEARQTLVITVAFIAIIVVAAVILVGALGIGYYSDHLATVARVDGVSLDKDQWNDRVKVLDFQINQAEGQIDQAVAAGTLDQSTAQQEIQSYEQQRQTEGSDALEDLINQAYMLKLGQAQGIGVSDADVDAELKKQSETPETRHVLAVVVTPQVSTGTDLPDQEQIDAAKTKADQALAALEAGQDFAAVAKQYSDAAGADSGGDYGDVTEDYPADQAWIKAIFAAPLNGTTDVIQGADGAYRIAKVTKITAAVPDPTFMTKLKAVVSLDAYRDALKGRVIQQKLQDKVVAEALKQPVEQVHAAEIEISVPASGTVASAIGGEVRASHILYSPNHDPSSATTLDASDPAWAAAKQLADAAVAKLKAISDVSEREKTFASMAESDSDDTGSATQGGDLGWASYSDFVTSFAEAIFDGDHTKGEIIGPVKSEYGYHVILWEAKRPDSKTFIGQLLDQAKQPGADFAALAKEHSDASDAEDGGDMGWIAKGQESDFRVEDALFALQAGQLSSSPVLLSDGYTIYKVTDRTTRALSSSQVSAIQTNAFNTWYLRQKQALEDAGKIYRDPTIAPASTGS